MAQHFLLSSKARTLSSYEIAQLSEEEAYDLLCELRWGEKSSSLVLNVGYNTSLIIFLHVNNGVANIVITLLVSLLAPFLPIARNRLRFISML